MGNREKITKQKMAGAAGLEPVTSAVTGQRSNQLSYAPAIGWNKVLEGMPTRQAELKAFFGYLHSLRGGNRWRWAQKMILEVSGS